MIYGSVFKFDPDSGHILQRISCPDTELRYYLPNAIFTADPAAADWNDLTHWVNGGVLTAREEMTGVTVDETEILADGIDLAVITGIPIGALAHADGVTVTVSDGTLPYATQIPGEHVIRLEAFPLLDLAITVTAVSPGAS